MILEGFFILIQYSLLYTPLYKVGHRCTILQEHRRQIIYPPNQCAMYCFLDK